MQNKYRERYRWLVNVEKHRLNNILNNNCFGHEEESVVPDKMLHLLNRLILLFKRRNIQYSRIEHPASSQDARSLNIE